VPLGNSERHGTQNAGHCHLFPVFPDPFCSCPVCAILNLYRENEMTPRERKDIPWILAAFAVLIVVMTGGAIFRWLKARPAPSASAISSSNLRLQPPTSPRPGISNPRRLGWATPGYPKLFGQVRKHGLTGVLGFGKRLKG
jgi:hypothetical protein